jgi:DNA-binding winged helix-turn-helix (wHTH) protein
VTYRFGTFAADRDGRQLVSEAREVHLSPKAFELLLTLIEHRSRAMSKAELEERLWPATFVGETNLPTLVAEIRRALGDSAQESTYVRTLHRFGYRFVAAVDEGPARPIDADPAVRMYLTGHGRRYPLAQGMTVIGRAEDATVRIDAGGVSRHHARIVVSGDEARVEDLASKNGTFVGGKPVAGSCVLRDGDEIRVGPLALTFKLSRPGDATETM